MRIRVKYLRENWGAPFVIAFMVLLIASAIYLSFGLNDVANSTAVYAFYSLVLGIALQVASYVKYGEGVESKVGEREPSVAIRFRPWSKRQKRIAMAMVAVVLAGAAASAFYYFSPEIIAVPRFEPHPTLSARVSFTRILAQSNGSRTVVFEVNPVGGSPPYGYTATWSDGFVQQTTTGIFTRTFANQTIPTSAEVVVRSSDGLTGKVYAPIPAS